MATTNGGSERDCVGELCWLYWRLSTASEELSLVGKVACRVHPWQRDGERTDLTWSRPVQGKQAQSYGSF
jgi:hypothetical protein